MFVVVVVGVVVVGKVLRQLNMNIILRLGMPLSMVPLDGGGAAINISFEGC